MLKQKSKWSDFGDAIKTKRVIELKLGLRELSKKIGVSAPTLSRIENGGIPDLGTYALLCQWINRPMDDFVGIAKFKKQKK